MKGGRELKQHTTTTTTMSSSRSYSSPPSSGRTSSTASFSSDDDDSNFVDEEEAVGTSSDSDYINRGNSINSYDRSKKSSRNNSSEEYRKKRRLREKRKKKQMKRSGYISEYVGGGPGSSIVSTATIDENKELAAGAIAAVRPIRSRENSRDLTIDGTSDEEDDATKSTSSATNGSPSIGGGESRTNMSDMSFVYSMSAIPNRERSNEIIDRALHKRRLEANKTLLIMYCFLLLESLIDLTMTMIGFVIYARQGECCGERIKFSKMFIYASSVPLFVLILVELCLWGKGVQLLLCYRPRGRSGTGTKLSTRSLGDAGMSTRSLSGGYSARSFSAAPALPSREKANTPLGLAKEKKTGVRRWTARMVAHMINSVTVFNPFFACVVAWMLLYQSSKLECFLVLSLESASLLLHFVAVYHVDKGKISTCNLLFHALPVLPFLLVLVLTLVYLEQGGVCYVVDQEKFWYDGCRMCEDGQPPIDNVCTITTTVWNNFTDPNTGVYKTVAANVTKSYFLDSTPWYTHQDTYCAEGESQAKFCFFTY